MCIRDSRDTLETRRLKYIDNFVRKTFRSERFSEDWFPLRREDFHNIRDRKPFKETRSRTTRYYNSPLSFMRRRANELYYEDNANVDASY